MASPQRMIRDVSPVSCVVWKIESERCVASGGTNAITASTASPPTATSDQASRLAMAGLAARQSSTEGSATAMPMTGPREPELMNVTATGASARASRARCRSVPARTIRKSRISDTSPIVRPSPITSIEASSE